LAAKRRRLISVKLKDTQAATPSYVLDRGSAGINKYADRDCICGQMLADEARPRRAYVARAFTVEYKSQSIAACVKCHERILKARDTANLYLYGF
jgi:hypothetical protein